MPHTETRFPCRWTNVLIDFVMGIVIFVGVVLIVSVVFFPASGYMGQDITETMLQLAMGFPSVFILAALEVFGLLFLIAALFSVLTLRTRLRLRLFLCLCLLLAVLLRVPVKYPAIAESWALFNLFPDARKYILFASSIEGSIRTLAENLALFGVCVLLVLNLWQHMRFFRQESVRKTNYLAEHISSKRLRLALVSFLWTAVLGATSLYHLRNAVNFSLPFRDPSLKNIILIGIDSLRYDKVTNGTLSLPFLNNFVKDAQIAQPLMTGISRTFPSWIEMATCRKSMDTGIRNMFPSKESRSHKPATIFGEASMRGYHTTMASDFAGDIFPRAHFGIQNVAAPTSNLKVLVQNGLIQNMSALQALLLYPKMHRKLPALLASPEFADPLLLLTTLNEQLNSAPDNKPIWASLFFSTAHFPYAAPAPWPQQLAKQRNTSLTQFKKRPDQNINPKTLGTAMNPVQSDLSIQHTRILYDSSLQAVDASLQILHNELNAKGWLKNAVFVVLGDHGENLYEGKLGMGHGDGVSGENATQSLFALWATGLHAKQTLPMLENREVGDVIGRAAGLDFEFCKPDLTKQGVYQESGLWFIGGDVSPESSPRWSYPGILDLVSVDADKDFEFVLKQKYFYPTNTVKERAWVNGEYRLIARTTRTGIVLSLYNRASDRASEFDLLLKPTDPKHLQIAETMFSEMLLYLESFGVRIVTLKSDRAMSFFNEPMSR